LDTRRHAVRVQRHAQHVHGRPHQLGGDSRREQRHGAVGAEHLPGAVDHHGRVGVVPLEDQVDRLAHWCHLGVLQVVLLERRGVSGREQQLVAVAQRHLEPFGELEHHVRARPRPAGLHEAEVTGRHARLERQIELAQAAPLAPVAQQRADARYRSGGGHATEATGARKVGHLPRR